MIDAMDVGSTLQHIQPKGIKFVDSEQVNEKARQVTAGTYVTLLFFLFFFSMCIASTVVELLDFRAMKKREALGLL